MLAINGIVFQQIYVFSADDTNSNGFFFLSFAFKCLSTFAMCTFCRCHVWQFIQWVMVFGYKLCDHQKIRTLKFELNSHKFWLLLNVQSCSKLFEAVNSISVCRHSFSLKWFDEFPVENCYRRAKCEKSNFSGVIIRLKVVNETSVRRE